MSKLLLSVLWPALGIVSAALVQLGVRALWPGVEHAPSAVVSIDSHIAILSMIGFCFLAGRWTQRHAPKRAGILCAVVAPLAWLGLMTKALLVPFHPIAWLAPLTLITAFAALAPLIGVLSGWALPITRPGDAVRAV